MEASVRSLMREDVLRIFDALKLALSRTILFVEAEMALGPPPMMPPMAIVPSGSAMTRFEGSSS